MKKGDKRRAAAEFKPSLLDGTNNQLVSANILSGQPSLSKGFPQAGAQSAARAGECSGRVLHEKPGRGVGSSSDLRTAGMAGKAATAGTSALSSSFVQLCPAALGFVHDQPRQQGMCGDLLVCSQLGRLHHQQLSNQPGMIIVRLTGGW